MRMFKAFMVAALVVAVSAGTASALVDNWQNAAGGLWSSVAIGDWSLGAPPTAADSAEFNLSGCTP